jgi:hypothetical protein
MATPDGRSWILAECRLILFEAEAAQPASEVHAVPPRPKRHFNSAAAIWYIKTGAETLQYPGNAEYRMGARAVRRCW